MTNWNRTVQIRDLLIDDESPGAIKSAADGIVSRLPSAPLAQIIKARNMADDDPETALLAFNAGLGTVYDWADFNRIWLS